MIADHQGEGDDKGNIAGTSIKNELSLVLIILCLS